MKFELMKVEKSFYDDIEYGVYIIRNEILKSFENDESICIEKIKIITKMLTTPYCYYYNWSEGEIEKTIDGLIEKKSFLGIMFWNKEIDNGNYQLSYGYKKREH